MIDMLFDNPAADEMFFEDSVEHLRRHVLVPGAVGMDDDDRAALANGETVAARPFDPHGISVEPMSFEFFAE